MKAQEDKVKTGLKPLVKWPGGKGSELLGLREYFPTNFDKFFEPFLGGGACYFSLNGQFKEAYVNDRCKDLIDFYKILKKENQTFYKYIKMLTCVWTSISEWVTNNSFVLISLYQNKKINEIINIFNKKRSAFEAEIIRFSKYETSKYFDFLNKSLSKKLSRMLALEKKKGTLLKQDILSNIEGALKSGLYNYIRYIYNLGNTHANVLHVVSFIFLREYCYSGMFRYSKKGDFNVPYGGLTYNSRKPDSKLAFWKNPQLKQHLKITTFESLDFEDFLKKYEPQKNDFIFMDPPYDTNFSTYAKNTFDQEDQKRLANWLLNKCQGKFLLVIKNTNFIKSLYDSNKIEVNSFGKRYSVSFKNRNNPDCEHLIITNKPRFTNKW